MKKIFVTLLCLMLCSCMTDYSCVSDIEYTNNSSYDILFLTIKQSPSADQQNIIETEKVIVTLPKGGTHIFSASEMGSKDGYLPFHVVPLFNNIARIQFGESAKIDFGNSKYGEESTYVITTEKKRYRKYTYTFTDADYQFALENGTKLEL